MSVIIRLQNLPWSANALDIRQYFSGLAIPEGGVHIVGGELGDAFIAFSTDEDARQAFNRNHGKIKEIQISLLLSSRQEMQKVIESARNPLAAFMQTSQVVPVVPMATPLPPTPLSVDLKKDDRKDDSKSRDDRRDRDGKRRSRSKSRDRRDRSSRDSDRRDRRRDRSRSRDRRDRRRDRRSRSRDRTRSKDRDRRSNDRRRDDSKRDDNGKNGNDSSNNQSDGGGDLRWEPPLAKNVPLLPHAQNNPLLGLLQQHQQQLQRPMIPPINNIPTALGGANLPILGNNLASQWPPMNMNMRNPNMDGPNNNAGPMNRMNNFRGGNNNNNSNMNMDQPNNFNRMMPGFHNINMDMRQNNGPNGPFPNNRPFQDNRMGFGRPPMGGPGPGPGPFNRGDGPPGPDFNNFNQNNQGRMGQRNNPASNCCIQLHSYFGGYSEIRKFFTGAFINNTGVKFVNDDTGNRTGTVYVRFVYPDGKQLALQRSGCLLKGEAVEIKHLDDEEFETLHVGGGYGGPRPPFDDMRNNQRLGMPPQRQQNFDHSSNQDNVQMSCVALEDIPNFVKERNIMNLYSDFPLISFLVVRVRKQRDSCAVAYVKFMKPEDAKQALNDKSFHVIEGKPIIVRPCSLEEFEDVSRQHNNGKSIIDLPNVGHSVSGSDKSEDVDDDDSRGYAGDNKSNCVFMSGLPFKITERDVADFFTDIGVVPTDIHMKPHGECYCEFRDASKAEIALEKNDTNLGTSVITVEMVSREDMDRALNANAPNTGGRMHSPAPQNFNQRFSFNRPGGPGPGPGPRQQGSMGGGPMGYRPPMRRMGGGGPPLCSVQLTNVPYKAGKEEIVEFFQSFDVTINNVHRRTDNGKPSGEAIVNFSSPAEAQRAVEEYNHNTLRERTVYLKLVPGPAGMNPGFDRNAFDG